jgi:hypothetical protein
MLTSPSKFLTGTIFLHAHLQAVYYNCVKFHLNPMSHLGGVVLTSPSLHTERISENKLNYPPSKFWTATIFFHAHLQVVYYKCVKFHKNPIRRSCTYKVHALLLFVKVQVELSPLPNVGKRPYFFNYICR